MSFIKDIWAFLKVRKKWWLAPIIIVLLLIGLLMLVANSSFVSSFVYTLF